MRHMITIIAIFHGSILHDVQERYRTLQIHGYEPLDEVNELEAAHNLTKRWADVKDLALTRDMRMVAVKERFSQVTSQQVADFQSMLETVYKEFKQTGPANAGNMIEGQELGLQEGLELMQRYELEAKGN